LCATGFYVISTQNNESSFRPHFFKLNSPDNGDSCADCIVTEKRHRLSFGTEINFIIMRSRSSKKTIAPELSSPISRALQFLARFECFSGQWITVDDWAMVLNDVFNVPRTLKAEMNATAVNVVPGVPGNQVLVEV
jgi:hypothetical protein